MSSDPNYTPNNQIADHPQLFNQDAEESAVGAVLINPGMFPALSLRPEHFHIHKLRFVWQALERLHQAGAPIDFVTVSDELEDAGKLAEIGGPAYLASLTNRTPSSLNAPTYAQIVREFAHRRKILRFANALAKAALDLDATPNGQVSEIAERLAQDRSESENDPWLPFTLTDAYQEREPVQYVAAGLFALPSLNIVYGSPGTLKSFLLQDLAVCVAAGIEWLPPAPWVNGNQARGVATLQQPTIWLDFDNGRRRTHDRFGALGRSRNLSPDSPIIYYSMPAPWLDSSDKTSVGELALRIQDKGAKVVFVDNLGVVSGDAEENSGEMGRVMSVWRQLAEDTGSAVVLIHHQRKSNGTIGRAGDTLRGHSSIEASLDLALLIDREDYSDTANIRATKMRGPDVLPFSATFTFEHDERGELHTAKFFGVAANDIKSDAAIEREVRAALVLEPTNKTGLVKAVREALKDDNGKSPGVNRIRNVIDRMESEGRIRAGSGSSTSNTEKVYGLP